MHLAETEFAFDKIIGRWPTRPTDNDPSQEDCPCPGRGASIPVLPASDWRDSDSDLSRRGWLAQRVGTGPKERNCHGSAGPFTSLVVRTERGAALPGGCLRPQQAKAPHGGVTGSCGAGLVTAARIEERHQAALAYPQVQEEIALLERAADRPHCDFHWDFSLGSKLQMLELADMKVGAKLLAVRAQRQSGGGDWRGALSSLRRARQIGRHANELPSLYAMVIGLKIDNIVESATRDVARLHRSDPVFLREGLRQVQAAPPLADLPRSMMGELVLQRIMIRQRKMIDEFWTCSDCNRDSAAWPSSMVDRLADQGQEAVFQNKGVQNALDRKLVEEYNRLIPALSSDPERWEDNAAVLARTAERVGKDLSLLNRTNQELLPLYENLTESIGQSIAERRLTRTVLQALLERAETGKFPSAVPTVDPFSHEPFVYRRLGNGFLVYSVGMNRVDDGGGLSPGGYYLDIVADFR